MVQWRRKFPGTDFPLRWKSCPWFEEEDRPFQQNRINSISSARSSQWKKKIYWISLENNKPTPTKNDHRPKLLKPPTVFFYLPVKVFKCDARWQWLRRGEATWIVLICAQVNREAAKRWCIKIVLVGSRIFGRSECECSAVWASTNTAVFFRAPSPLGAAVSTLWAYTQHTQEQPHHEESNTADPGYLGVRRLCYR